MHKPTVEVYDNVAQIYDQVTTDYWDKFPTEPIEKFSGRVRGGLVLNLGCGPSRDGEFLRQTGLNIIGLDASSTMAEITQKKGFPIIQADAIELPFRDSTFEGVWAFTSLIHLPPSDLLVAFIEARRVLKKYGTFAFGYIMGTAKGNRKTSFSEGKDMLFNNYLVSEVDQLLKEAGFVNFHSFYYKPHETIYGLTFSRIQQ